MGQVTKDQVVTKLLPASDGLMLQLSTPTPNNHRKGSASEPQHRSIRCTASGRNKPIPHPPTPPGRGQIGEKLFLTPQGHV